MTLERSTWLAGLVSVLALGCSSSTTSPATSDAGTTIPTGLPSSTPIAAIGTDAVFVINGGDNSISVVDPSAAAVVGTIQLSYASYPHHIYLSPDRSMLAVAIPGMDLSMGHDQIGGHDVHGAVMVLETTTGKTLASRVLDMMNHNAVFSPDGSEIWTSQVMMPGQVLVLDAKTLETRQTIAVGDMPAEVTFSPDGKSAFVANGMSNDVTVIDPSTKKVVKTIPVDSNPVGAWPGADSRLYVDCEKAMTVKAIDIATLTVVQSYNLGFMPGMARAANANDLWVTNSDDGKVVFDMTSMDHKMGETTTGPGAHGLAFSADGKLAFVTNQADASLTILNVATQKVTGTVKVGSKPNGLVSGLKGRRIAA